MTTIQDIADKMKISKSTVSKALNDAPDISETLRKQVLETAVALGYTKLRRYRKPVKKICIITEKENIQYEEPHHFAYDILLGFRQMAEPAGFDIEIVPVDVQMQRNQHYDVFMLEHDYVGAFAIGFSLNDPWIQDFKTSHTPAVLFDNYIIGNPSTAYVWLIMMREWNLLFLILLDLVIVRLPISAVLLVLRFFRYDMLPSSVPCTSMD